MAGCFGSLDFNIYCHGCSEDFTETGERVPRRFPCGHSLCEKCLGKFINGSWIKCPQCRRKWLNTKDVKKFPLNEYIIDNVRRQDVNREDTGGFMGGAPSARPYPKDPNSLNFMQRFAAGDRLRRSMPPPTGSTPPPTGSTPPPTGSTPPPTGFTFPPTRSTLTLTRSPSPPTRSPPTPTGSTPPPTGSTPPPTGSTPPIQRFLDPPPEESGTLYQRDLCKEHEKKIVLFCNDCETFLCTECEESSHDGHDIMGKEEKETEEIVARADEQAESINLCIQNSKLANLQNKHSLKKLVYLKEDLSSRIQKMNTWIKSMEAMQENENIPEQLKPLENSINLIQNVKDNLNNKEGVTQEELIGVKQAIESITESSNTQMAKLQHFIVFVLPDIDKAIWPDLTLEGISAADWQQHTTYLSRTEQQLGYASNNSIIALCSTVDDRFVALQKNESGDFILQEYWPSDGEIKKEVELDGDASCIAKVTVRDTPCLAVAYPYHQKVQFRCVLNLEDVRLVFIMKRQEPWGMCAVGPSVLALRGANNLVSFIDCSSNPPIVDYRSRSNWFSKKSQVYAMCGVTLAERELLFITRLRSDISQIVAFERKTGKELWVVEEVQVSGKKQNILAHGITADDSGHIYVTDERNSCIYMFWVDGQFVGPVMTKGGGKILHLQKPTVICWSSHLRSLIVAHKSASCELNVFTMVELKRTEQHEKHRINLNPIAETVDV